MKNRFGVASFIFVFFFAVPAWGQAGTTTIVSINDAGMQANSGSQIDSMSADGRYVVFRSSATNLAPGVGDNGNSHHIYVHDRDADDDGVFDEPGAVKTVIVSVSGDGQYGNHNSSNGQISADGRFIAFASESTNLVPGEDANGKTYDVFIHDRDTDEDGVFDEPGAISTELASLSSDGQQGNNMSYWPAISADGRHVAYASYATNLTNTGDANAHFTDVFVHNRESNTTTRVSIASDGTQGNFTSFTPSISADGRLIAFASISTNLVPGENANGPYWEIFVHDRDTDEDGIFDEPGAISTELASLSSDGQRGNDDSRLPSISAVGRYVAYNSYATNLHPSVDPDGSGPYILVRDRQTGTTKLISEDRNGPEHPLNQFSEPQISDDGRFVAFNSAAAELIPGGDANGREPDIFIHDRDVDRNGIFDEPGSTATEVVSTSSAGQQGDFGSFRPQLSADGRYVGFYSVSINTLSDFLDGKDANFWFKDVFVHDRGPQSQPPVAACRDRTVPTDPGLCTATVSVDDGSSDADGGTVTMAQAPPGPYGLGLTEIAMTAYNHGDLSDSCLATVNVVDRRLPNVTCPAPQTLECTGPSGAVASYGYSSTDNCGVTTSACDVPTGSTFAPGSTDVVCSAIDGSFNQGTCRFTVAVVDTTAPTVTAELSPIARKGRRREGSDHDREHGRGHREGRYEVVFSASDGCDHSIRATAVLDVTGLPSPIPITNGQIVTFEYEDDESEAETKHGFLRIEAPGMTLRVSATDSSGNTSTAEARPIFHGGKRDRDISDSDRRRNSARRHSNSKHRKRGS